MADFLYFGLSFFNRFDQNQNYRFVTAMIVGTFIPSIMGVWFYMFKNQPGLKLQ
jgi:hypothetical protein